MCSATGYFDFYIYKNVTIDFSPFHELKIGFEIFDLEKFFMSTNTLEMLSKLERIRRMMT